MQQLNGHMNTLKAQGGSISMSAIGGNANILTAQGGSIITAEISGDDNSLTSATHITAQEESSTPI